MSNAKMSPLLPSMLAAAAMGVPPGMGMPSFPLSYKKNPFMPHDLDGMDVELETRMNQLKRVQAAMDRVKNTPCAWNLDAQGFQDIMDTIRVMLTQLSARDMLPNANLEALQAKNETDFKKLEEQLLALVQRNYVRKNPDYNPDEKDIKKFSSCPLIVPALGITKFAYPRIGVHTASIHQLGRGVWRILIDLLSLHPEVNEMASKNLGPTPWRNDVPMLPPRFLKKGWAEPIFSIGNKYHVYYGIDGMIRPKAPPMSNVFEAGKTLKPEADLAISEWVFIPYGETLEETVDQSRWIKCSTPEASLQWNLLGRNPHKAIEKYGEDMFVELMVGAMHIIR